MSLLLLEPGGGTFYYTLVGVPLRAKREILCKYINHLRLFFCRVKALCCSVCQDMCVVSHSYIIKHYAESCVVPYPFYILLEVSCARLAVFACNFDCLSRC